MRTTVSIASAIFIACIGGETAAWAKPAASKKASLVVCIAPSGVLVARTKKCKSTETQAQLSLLKGADGSPGAPGTQGTKGTDGAPGLTGVTGATGPQGTQGVTGATGADGSAGSPGTSGRVILSGGQNYNIAAFTSQFFSVDCDTAGKKAIGGGCSSGNSAVLLRSSYPSDSVVSTSSYWVCEFQNTTNATQGAFLSAFAVCADVQ